MMDVYKECLMDLAKNKDVSVRLAMASSLLCPRDVQEILAKDHHGGVRGNLAASPVVEGDILSSLIRNDESLSVALQAVSNPKTTTEDIVYSYKNWKADKQNNRMAHVIAKHKNTNVELLMEMTNRTSERPKKFDLDFLIFIAKNPNATEELLEEMLKKRSSRIHEAVASNPNISSDRMELFLNDTNPFIKKGLASNPKCPQEYIEQLAEDKSGFVREAVAGNPNVSVEALTKLASDSVWQVKKAVGENVKTTEEVLLKLASDFTFDRVLISIAKNKNLGNYTEVLGKLIEYGKQPVLLEVYENEGVTKDQKSMLFMLTGTSIEDLKDHLYRYWE